MSRVTAHERGGLGLLELLYRNNLLVHTWLTERERQMLKDISKKFRQVVEEAGYFGLEAEAFIHWGLCLVEIHAVDDPETLLRYQKPDLGLVGITPEQYIKLNDATRGFMAAMNLCILRINGAENETLIDSLSELALREAGELKQASTACRVRFSERAFSAEYPDAPIDMFSWLAALRVIEIGTQKYSTPAIAPDLAYQAQAYRAALLIQFESLRKYLVGACSSKDIVRKTYSRLTTAKDAPTIEAMSKWEDAVGERVHLPKLKNSIISIDSTKWQLCDARTIRSTFANFPSLAPSYQAFLTKRSTALTDIAGAMIRTHPWSEEKVGMGSFSHTSDSKAKYVQEELEKRGFRIGARTIHLHNRNSVQKHVELLEYYTVMLRNVPLVFPCHNEDGCLVYLNGCAKAPLDQIFELRRNRQVARANAEALPPV
jgi:hypothetical protein